APRENTHARPLVEFEQRECEIVESLFVDLEQLVAREILQNGRKRLAGMAVRIEAEALLDMNDLAPQIRDAVSRARVGRRREQADDANLAEQVAFLVETLDADVIEIGAAVDQRFDVRLGDEQRPWLLEERHDLRRELEQIVAAPEHAQFGRTHDSQRGAVIRLEAISG